ncbi:hypothetical protein [Ancylobacter sp.]|uniref:hypothetical protein n=1 Tax=Ancylobacter sp. TaxID=1872567 RepID=UPI003BADA197
MQIDIPSSLAGFIDATLIRLQSQFPETVFERTPAGIQVDAGNLAPEHLRSAVLHAVYREKIYAETLPLREELLNRVLR